MYEKPVRVFLVVVNNHHESGVVLFVQLHVVFTGRMAPERANLPDAVTKSRGHHFAEGSYKVNRHPEGDMARRLVALALCRFALSCSLCSAVLLGLSVVRVCSVPIFSVSAPTNYYFLIKLKRFCVLTFTGSFNFPNCLEADAP